MFFGVNQHTIQQFPKAYGDNEPYETFEKMCDPAKLYLLLSLASVIVYLIHFAKVGSLPKLSELGIQVIVMFIWTFILNKVCTFKYGVKISWFLVALPIVL